MSKGLSRRTPGRLSQPSVSLSTLSASTSTLPVCRRRRRQSIGREHRDPGLGRYESDKGKGLKGNVQSEYWHFQSNPASNQTALSSPPQSARPLRLYSLPSFISFYIHIHISSVVVVVLSTANVAQYTVIKSLPTELLKTPAASGHDAQPIALAAAWRARHPRPTKPAELAAAAVARKRLPPPVPEHALTRRGGRALAPRHSAHVDRKRELADSRIVLGLPQTKRRRKEEQRCEHKVAHSTAQRNRHCADQECPGRLASFIIVDLGNIRHTLASTCAVIQYSFIHVRQGGKEGRARCW